MSNHQNSDSQRSCCGKSTSISSLRASIHNLLQHLQPRPAAECCPSRREFSWSHLLTSVLPSWMTTTPRSAGMDEKEICNRVACPTKKPCASRPCTPKPCTRACTSGNTEPCCSRESADRRGSRVSSERVLSNYNFEDLPSERSYEFEQAANSCACTSLERNRQLQKSLKELNSESVCRYCNLSRCSTNSVCRKSLLSEAWGYLKRLVSDHKSRCTRCNKNKTSTEVRPCAKAEPPCKQTLLEQVRQFFIQSCSEHKNTCEKCKQRQYCPNTKDRCLTDYLVEQAMVYIIKKLGSCTKLESVHQQVPQYTPPQKCAISCQRSTIKDSVSKCCEHCESRGKSPCCKHSKWALERNILSGECCDTTNSCELEATLNKRERNKSAEKGLHCSFDTHSFQTDLSPPPKPTLFTTGVCYTPSKKCSIQISCEPADLKPCCQSGPCQRCPRDKKPKSGVSLCKQPSDDKLSKHTGSKPCCPASPCAQSPPPCLPPEDPLPPCDCPPTSNANSSGPRSSCACPPTSPPQPCAPQRRASPPCASSPCAPPPRAPPPCATPPCKPAPCATPPCKPAPCAAPPSKPAPCASPPCKPAPCAVPPCKPAPCTPPPCPPPPCAPPPRTPSPCAPRPCPKCSTKPCKEPCQSVSSKKSAEECPALKKSGSDISIKRCAICNASVTSAHAICNIRRKEMIDEQFEAFLDEKFGRRKATRRVHDKETTCSDKSCDCVVCNCPRSFDSSGIW